ncbi:MAG: hypothetical protein CVT64_03360 [Actinobacteria bacterium HGW-Actinobacteria-4]|nr:MAG: hypothetical protein CVT64_03360 [Actinobacteria bacterium HGW-Actinobacteria-4]
MRDLQELLNESFEGHSHQVQARGGWDHGRQRAAMSSIRRRRTARTAGMGGATVFAVSALAFAAVNLPGVRSVGPAAPTPSIDWCDVDPYLPANIDAMGDAGYLGRAYIDLSTDTFIYVHPDGTRENLAPNSEGWYMVPGTEFPVWNVNDVAWATRMAVDTFDPEGPGVFAMGGNIDTDGPMTGHEWTTAVPDNVPAGVDTAGLSTTLLYSLGFGGMGLSSSWIPQGSAAAIVVTRTDGTEEEYPLEFDQEGPDPSEFGTDSLASVEIRVTGLPGGETFSIVSTYDPTQVPGYGCAPEPSPSPDPSANAGVDPFGEPTSGVDAPFAPLHGPESAVFACLAPLPADLEGVMTTAVTWTSGEVNVGGSPNTNDVFDVGTRGIEVRTEFPVAWHASLPDVPGPGWHGAWEHLGEGLETMGALYFEALVWERGGTIVAVRVKDPNTTIGSSTTAFLAEGTDPGVQEVVSAHADPEQYVAMCDGSPDDTLGDANLVILQGSGPTPDQMTYSWTRATE